MSIYLTLTEKFNAGRVRVVVCSGQATVLHRLAMMSKDGDWIIRDDDEAFSWVLSVLAGFKAKYRLGAPLDRRWLSGGWSSHFEFFLEGLRVRADFFSRPPRIESEDLASLWREAENQAIPVVNLHCLAEQKKTMREKDYPIIGALADRMTDVHQKLKYARNAQAIIELSSKYPDLLQEAAKSRPLLLDVSKGREALEESLDRERRRFMRLDEDRLLRFSEAGAPWVAKWGLLSRDASSLELLDAHKLLVESATGVLPVGVL